MCVSAVLTAALVAQSPGLGRFDFPTSGPPAAQRHFLDGVAYLHSFEYDDAIAAFRRARAAAPHFAMAYWGEALSYSQPLWYREDVAKARAVLAMLGSSPAARAAKAGSDRERMYLAAVDELYGQGDQASRHAAYARAMRRLVAAHPKDDEAAAFLALALLATIAEGGRDPAVSLEAGAVASGVLDRNPEHPGAAHYVLHAYDDGVHNRLGLKAARLYARIAPQSSHALHMPSHVFLPLGMWDEATASNEASFAASVAWAERTGRAAAQHDFHSLSWLHYSYLQQGRFAKARETEQTVARALASSGEAGGHHPGHAESEIGRGYGAMSLRNELASMRARYVVESRDWARMKGASSFDNIDELFALGLSSVGLGDIGRANAAITQLRSAGTASERDLREVSVIMADQIDGLVRFAGGDRTGAFVALRRAAAAEAARPRPIARPYPIKPAGELLAEMMLASGDAGGAVKQFHAVLDRTPRRAAAMMGLAFARAAAGHTTAARKTAQEFVAMWHAADTDRSELTDLKALIE